MVAISISEIQRDLPGYLRRVQAGEVFVITDQDQPIAEVKPIAPVPNGQRPAGLCAGEFEVPENFDDPLPESVLRDFGS
jgi:antitoxin (DNA-binding transcriptional repressor) of toxin-antitoxin stability system